MATTPSSDKDNKTAGAPAPEVLQPQSDTSTPNPSPNAAPAGKTKQPGRLKRGTYRPSHKATFIGLAVVVLILGLNAAVITYVMRGGETANSAVNGNEVVLSPTVLDGLGVSRNAAGSKGTELVVGPDSRFSGKLTVGSDVTIGGQLSLNSKFSAADASLAKLQAGDTSVNQLNVNGDGTVSNFNLRQNLSVAGTTRLQGPVTLNQLLTVANNVNVSGNLAVGGILTARGFQASSLTSDTTLTIGGHVITRGAAPNVGRGPAVGSGGTVSLSGNDAAGTIAVNTGGGAGNGVLAQVAFRNQYGSTPRVVVSAVGGPGMGSLYVTRTVGGFTVGVNGAVPPGGYAIDYIVMQ